MKQGGGERRGGGEAGGVATRQTGMSSRKRRRNASPSIAEIRKDDSDDMQEKPGLDRKQELPGAKKGRREGEAPRQDPGGAEGADENDGQDGEGPSSWESCLRALESYKNDPAHKGKDPPAEFKVEVGDGNGELHLGHWCDIQRMQYRKKEGDPQRLSAERVRRLNAIGFCWENSGGGSSGSSSSSSQQQQQQSQPKRQQSGRTRKPSGNMGGSTPFLGRRDLEYLERLTWRVLAVLQTSGPCSLLEITHRLSSTDKPIDPKAVAEVLDVLYATPLVSIVSKRNTRSHASSSSASAASLATQPIRYQYSQGNHKLPRAVNLATIQQVYLTDLRRTILRDDRISLLRSALALAKKTKEDGFLSELKEEVAENNLESSAATATSSGRRATTNELIKQSFRVPTSVDPSSMPSSVSNPSQ